MMAEAEEYIIGDIVMVPFPMTKRLGPIIVTGKDRYGIYEGIYYDPGAKCPSSTSFLAADVERKTGNIFNLIEQLERVKKKYDRN
jgi:hypothetical protein